MLGQAAVFCRGDGAAADIDEAVCTDRFQCAAFNALDIDIAFDRDRGIVSCRYQRGKIAPVIGEVVLIDAVGAYRLKVRSPLMTTSLFDPIVLLVCTAEAL